MSENANRIEEFKFRDLIPNVFLGTASDRYAGWMGQIYSREKYEGRITTRTKSVRRKSFTEKTLPVECVKEYFEHFSVLEIDYTFYAPLSDNKGEPSRTFHVLKRYRDHMKEDARVILKVPQIISTQRLWRGSQYMKNDGYLNPEVFNRQFYLPATEILGNTLKAMIFEQAYQRKKERLPIKRIAEDFDRFFETIPKDHRYHFELRTEAYLGESVFNVLGKHGVGQVLSYWTWLPGLRKQLEKAEGRIFNSKNQRIIRLMTPRGMRYEDAYAKAHPFDNLVEGMLQSEMIEETVALMNEAAKKGIETNVVINNRAGGNAPKIAQKLLERVFKEGSPFKAFG